MVVVDRKNAGRGAGATKSEYATLGVMDQDKILEGLKRDWGDDSVRAMQERIVRSLVAGRDACVVMPTGGGKSLCYQLPAAMSHDKTVVVISPLIALMQDQLAQLTQMGIAAGALNSAVDAGE